MTAQQIAHDDALDVAALYVLDALTPEERAAVDDHLASCAQDHSLFGELRATTPALASLVEQVDAPTALKDRVMAAYHSDSASPVLDSAKPALSASVAIGPGHQRVPVPAEAPHPAHLPVAGWMGWAAAAVAVVLLAVVGVYGLNVRQQADEANQRADQIAQAVVALTAPGSQVAVLRGTGAAATVSGFAAFPGPVSAEAGYMVLTGVPAAPNGMIYQAWYIADGAASSAGTMAPNSDGSVVVRLQPLDGAGEVALTLEPTGGSDQPTSHPIIVGDVTTRS